MRAELGLPSVKGDDEQGGGMMGGFGGSMGGAGGPGGKAKRPINVKFEIPYFTTSGIQVRYLKIIEPKVRGRHFLRLFRALFTFPCAIFQSRNGDMALSKLATFWRPKAQTSLSLDQAQQAIPSRAMDGPVGGGFPGLCPPAAAVGARASEKRDGGDLCFIGAGGGHSLESQHFLHLVISISRSLFTVWLTGV